MLIHSYTNNLNVRCHLRKAHSWIDSIHPSVAAYALSWQILPTDWAAKLTFHLHSSSNYSFGPVVCTIASDNSFRITKSSFYLSMWIKKKMMENKRLCSNYLMQWVVMLICLLVPMIHWMTVEARLLPTESFLNDFLHGPQWNTLIDCPLRENGFLVPWRHTIK